MLELRRYADSPLSSGWTATTDVGDVTSESTASYGSPPRKWENPARTIGRLAQLHVTRADLAAATSMLASALTIWGPKHDRALTHVMRYLAKHRSRVIVYRSAAAVGNAPALTPATRQPTPAGTWASPAPQPARRLLPDERARAPRFVWRGALLR